ncbi:50S ribosomal protein L23 [Blattabacterium cuenoti]|uniref:50S ribosomal protein L23 n=1 Tax=Blattabacterium cuenoti TaxID=1653831 RepID=UPI00163C7179|nr:50S ribosomal protein L23 [Blattabacterium cuenoti]
MILIKIFITKKSLINEKNNFYTFITKVNCNKKQIKKEIFNLFGHKVIKVKTILYPKKDKSKFTKKGFLKGKMSRFKKIIVKFNKKINFNKLFDNKNYNGDKKIETDNTKSEIQSCK